MKKKNGFTLIELMATILVLAIVISIVVIVALNVIRSAKTKSYEVTVKNIESNANNYLIETKKDADFTTREDDANLEYQCLRVQDLIDHGYLKNDVIESKISEKQTVTVSDYIYVERDVNNKGITKVIYLEDLKTEENNIEKYNTYKAYCTEVANKKAYVDITSYPEKDAIADEKKVTLKYMINGSIGPTNGEYKYTYEYKPDKDGNGGHIKEGTIHGEGDFIPEKDMIVDTNGIMYGTIWQSKKTIDENGEEVIECTIIRTDHLHITGRDNTPPAIEVKTNINMKQITSPVELICTDTDSQIVKYYYGNTPPTDEEFVNGYQPVTPKSEIKISKTISKAGTY